MDPAGICWPSFFFLLFGSLTSAFALAVVFSSNIVRMAFYLVLSLGATAGLFFLAGADFVGAMQLMIYVGGTLVLLVFGVMLTAQSTFISMKTRGGEWVIAAVVGGSLLTLLVSAAFSVPEWQGKTRAEAEEFDKLAVRPTATRIGMGLTGVRVDRLGNSSVQYGIAIFREGEQEAAAHGHFVHVFVERAANRSVPIPQNLRKALERLQT